MVLVLNGNDWCDEPSSFFIREDVEEDEESELGEREVAFFMVALAPCFSSTLLIENEERSIPLIGWESEPSMSEIGTKSTFGFFKMNPLLSKERSWMPDALDTDNLFFMDGDIKPLLLLSNDVVFESLLEAPRIFLRSFDFTFNELPVDNFVIVTEPMDDPLVGPGELGSLVSEAFEDGLEVTVDDIVDFSDPEFKDGSNLSLDELEELDESFDEELYCPMDIESLHLTGEMVTPSFLPLLEGVFDVEPNNLPIASSTLSLFKSLFGLCK